MCFGHTQICIPLLEGVGVEADYDIEITVKSTVDGSEIKCADTVVEANLGKSKMFLSSSFVKENKYSLIQNAGSGINEEYDTVNKTMYFDNLEDIKQYANEIICFYSNNDPYVKYDVEKDFADKIATEQVLIPNAGHINSESGYDTFEDIVNYI